MSGAIREADVGAIFPTPRDRRGAIEHRKIICVIHTTSQCDEHKRAFGAFLAFDGCSSEPDDAATKQFQNQVWNTIGNICICTSILQVV